MKRSRKYEEKEDEQEESKTYQEGSTKEGEKGRDLMVLYSSVSSLKGYSTLASLLPGISECGLALFLSLRRGEKRKKKR